jgi:ribosomal protein S18 acetylase RimI-like enzyme
MIIRPATAKDAPALWGILEPMIRAGETYALDRDLGRDAALAYWTAPANMVFVAETGNRICGTYYLRANQPGGGVANCGYVTAADAMGRGIGRAMALHSLAEAKMRGFAAMQFNFVVSSNAKAIALWQSLGFETVGRLPGAFRHPVRGPVDALVMFRAL